MYINKLLYVIGDEGITGLYNQFDSTAVVISEAAVVFETIGFGEAFQIYIYYIYACILCSNIY